MKTLTTAARAILRARAHDLSPLVRISAKGLSETVLKEIDRCLTAHELLKIRLFDADRDARELMLAEICAAVDAAPVQHIGKLLVIWRENPAATVTATPATPPRRRAGPRLTKKALGEGLTKPRRRPAKKI